MRRPSLVTASASLLVLALSASFAFDASAADLDAGALDGDVEGGALEGGAQPADDLAQMGRRLLDTQDLVQMGGHLLEQPAPKARASAKEAGAGGPAGVAGLGQGTSAGGAGQAAGAVEGVVAGGDAAAGMEADGSVVGAEIDAASDVDAALAALPDAGVSPAAQATSGGAPPDDEGSSAGGRAHGGGHGGSGARHDVLEMKGAEESPLAKLGIPVQAVPAVATVASTGILAIWPGLSKTLMGLFKSFAASKLKNKGKQGQKVDKAMKAFNVFGVSLRPAELGAICVAALVYGLAVCYGFQGWKMKSAFVVQQEGLVLAIYYARSVVRFVYERAYKLTTQYRFWPMGGVMCLGSAYLGTTLGTVGYELEASSGPDDAKRIVKMKAVLIAVALGMALLFFAWNLKSPAKLLQSGRVMMSGAALAEVLPITPMPGRKIYEWNKAAWVVLFVLVVPTFFVINFAFK